MITTIEIINALNATVKDLQVSVGSHELMKKRINNLLLQDSTDASEIKLALNRILNDVDPD